MNEELIRVPFCPYMSSCTPKNRKNKRWRGVKNAIIRELKSGGRRREREDERMGADVTEIGFNQSEFRLFVRPREIAFVDKGPFRNFSFCSSVQAASSDAKWK